MIVFIMNTTAKTMVTSWIEDEYEELNCQYNGNCDRLIYSHCARQNVKSSDLRQGKRKKKKETWKRKQKKLILCYGSYCKLNCWQLHSQSIYFMITALEKSCTVQYGAVQHNTVQYSTIWVWYTGRVHWRYIRLKVLLPWNCDSRLPITTKYICCGLLGLWGRNEDERTKAKVAAVTTTVGLALRYQLVRWWWR